MRLVDEFRATDAVRTLTAAIAAAATRPMTLMEVCGTHTMAIARAGLRALLPPHVRLVSGPGCPVCVTAQGDIDAFLALGERRDVVLTCFGDMMRVPGSSGSLEQLRARGAEVRVVYSPMDAVLLAAEMPAKQVVFFGIGFETTAPTVAAALAEARRRNILNFSVLSAHKTIPGALAALASAPDLALDGFLLPGHVSVVLGEAPYHFLAREHGVACAITGFEVTDILDGILSLATQIGRGHPTVENRYSRVVRSEGNPTARALVESVFLPADATWRGLGRLPGTGLEIRPEFAAWNARARFQDLDWERYQDAPEPQGCRCGEVLKGALSPRDCPLFGSACTPPRPVGPCMVSSEGTCAAFFRYQVA